MRQGPASLHGSLNPPCMAGQELTCLQGAEDGAVNLLQPCCVLAAVCTRLVSCTLDCHHHLPEPVLNVAHGHILSQGAAINTLRCEKRRCSRGGAAEGGRKRANESCKNCCFAAEDTHVLLSLGRLEKERCWLYCLLKAFFWLVCS